MEKLPLLSSEVIERLRASGTLKIDAFRISASASPGCVDIDLLSEGRPIAIAAQAFSLLALSDTAARHTFHMDTLPWFEEAAPLLRSLDIVNDSSVAQLAKSRNEWRSLTHKQEQTICDKNYRIATLEEEVSQLRALLVQTTTAMDAAHDSLFTQCLSNGVKNAWGKDVDCTLVNDLQSVSMTAKKRVLDLGMQAIPEAPNVKPD